MRKQRVHAFPEIRPCNALMYYPEANELVPCSVDPYSKTPAFKNVLVRVEAGGRAQRSIPFFIRKFIDFLNQLLFL